MKYFPRTSLVTALAAGLMVFAAATAKADQVGFTTSGTLSESGNETFTFLGGIGWTTIPSGTDVVVGALSGTLDFNRGIVYTVNPSYTIALPVPGFIGPPESGTTTTEGSAPTPEPTALLLLGTGLACVAGLVRRKLKAGD